MSNVCGFLNVMGFGSCLDDWGELRVGFSGQGDGFLLGCHNEKTVVSGRSLVLFSRTS